MCLLIKSQETFSIFPSQGFFSFSKVCSEHMNDRQYLSLGVRRTKWNNFPQKQILRFSCALTFLMVTWHVMWLKLENEENWRIGLRIYFDWININIKIPNFLRLEWMYAKFKIKVFIWLIWAFKMMFSLIIFIEKTKKKIWIRKMLFFDFFP